MGVRVLCGLLVAALLVGTTAEANARGRRGSGGRTTHYHYGIGAVGTPRSQPANPPAPAAQNQFPPCPPQAPCTTAGGRRYVTDSETGVSRFLPQ